MKISDYYAEVLRNHGVHYVFGLQGSGTALQLFDSIAHYDDIDYVCTLHEQSAGMAADGYASISGGLGVCIVDSGPAVTNLYTCVAGAYYNSTPMLFIVAQPQTHMLRKDLKLRHYSYHEAEILTAYTPITKYTAQVTDPHRACYEIEKAIYMAEEGRPGPVMLALPDDITWLSIEPEKLEHFHPESTTDETACQASEKSYSSCLDIMMEAKRPVLLLGNGVRQGKATVEARELIDLLGWPVALTFAIRDLIPDSHPLNTGSFGIQGTRSGNFALQNADCILVIGSRLDPFEIGQPADNFARDAKIIVVDIDAHELDKFSDYHIPCTLALRLDAKIFLCSLIKKIKSSGYCFTNLSWCTTIKTWRHKYPVFLDTYYKESSINPYALVEQLSLLSDENDVIVTDTGSARNYIFQSFACKENQRLTSWLNFACLGYGLPAAIGACFAHTGRVLTIMGDGGLQFNIQELATVVYHKLNLKIFIFDNDGYSSIQHAQDNYLEGRHHATDRQHGLPLPNSSKIAAAYGLPVIEVYKNDELQEKIREALSQNGPVFCNLHLSISHWTTPVRKGKDPIEDLSPKLPRDEFYKEMIIPPIS